MQCVFKELWSRERFMLAQSTILSGRGCRSSLDCAGSAGVGLWLPFHLLLMNEHMAISSWIGILRRFVHSRKPRPRRRAEPFGLAARGVQVEQFETRAMLSAGPVIVLAPPGPLNYVEHSGAVVIASASTV